MKHACRTRSGACACFMAPFSCAMSDRHPVESNGLQRGAHSAIRTERWVFTFTISRALFLNRLNAVSIKRADSSWRKCEPDSPLFYSEEGPFLPFISAPRERIPAVRVKRFSLTRNVWWHEQRGQIRHFFASRPLTCLSGPRQP